MKSYYHSLTKPPYLDEELNLNDAIPVMKKNTESLSKVLSIMNDRKKKNVLYLLFGW